MSKDESETLKVGDRAPAFSLRNQKGETRTLAKALEAGPLLLGFHRGSW